ncbi:MAG: class I SAM-dependent methyltransferase, partial [Candidatus Methylomirabilales bacterium]
MKSATVVSTTRVDTPEIAREYWEEYFAVAQRLGYSWMDEAKGFVPLVAYLRKVGAARVLDLGCGAGDVGSLLSRSGFRVIGLDLAGSALRFARERHPTLEVVQADLSTRLPFRSGTFDAVVTCLALHYFSWNTTVAILREVYRLISEGGIFFFRVNSTADRAHGAGRGRQVEPNLYERGGRLKRFFDEADCRSLVRDLNLLLLEHRQVPHLDCVDGCWGVRHKAVWDGLAQK